MNSRFIVTGMPFTPMAWLAMFLTLERSICYCEPNLGIKDISEIGGKLTSEFYRHMGMAGTGLGFFLPQIIQEVAPRILVIDRHPDEVNATLAQLGVPDTDYADKLYRRLQSVRGHPSVLWMKAEALQTRRGAEKAFFHCVPGEAFDQERFDLLSKMLVEVDPRYANRTAIESTQGDIPMIRNIGQILAAPESVH